MNQDFNLRFDEYKENDPTAVPGKEGNPDYYSSTGNTRNLAFIWPDGKMQFFNYSYLITCSFDKDKGSLQMEFSSHYIEIKGQYLEQLFLELLGQVNKIIRIADKRYTVLDEKDKSVISEVNIHAKAE
jgi:hypothetical protein